MTLHTRFIKLIHRKSFINKKKGCVYMKEMIILNNLTLVKAKRVGKSVWDNRTKRFIYNNDQLETTLSLFSEDEEVYSKLASAYENTHEKFVPRWFKEKEGYINLKSNFDIPVLTTNDEETTLVDLINESPTLIGSKVNISLTLADGAVYPNAIKIIEEGEVKNPFEGL